MGVTSDPNDPCIQNIDPETNMQACYLVLSEDERSKGYVRPLRTTYIHDVCGGATTMGFAIAETYARDPRFYGGTYCAKCRDHFPIGERGQFSWEDGNKVGT